jgi:hypothetical protein
MLQDSEEVRFCGTGDGPGTARTAPARSSEGGSYNWDRVAWTPTPVDNSGTGEGIGPRSGTETVEWTVPWMGVRILTPVTCGNDVGLGGFEPPTP